MPDRAHQVHTTKKNEKRLINRICAVFAVLMPLTVLPQVYMLFSTQNTEGLSLAMWVLYTVCSIPFLIFGLTYKLGQLVVLNSLWIVMQSVMIVGILMYRA